MKLQYNEETILDSKQRNPVKVGLIGNSISIYDNEDNIILSDEEAIKLIRVLSEHFFA